LSLSPRGGIKLSLDSRLSSVARWWDALSEFGALSSPI